MKTIIFITIILTVLNYFSFNAFAQQDDIQKKTKEIDSICKAIDKNIKNYQIYKIPKTGWTTIDESEGGWTTITCFYDKGKIVKINNIAISAEDEDKSKDKTELYYQNSNLIYVRSSMPLSKRKKRVKEDYFSDNKLIKMSEDNNILSISNSFHQKEGERTKEFSNFIIEFINNYKKSNEIDSICKIINKNLALYQIIEMPFTFFDKDEDIERSNKEWRDIDSMEIEEYKNLNLSRPSKSISHIKEDKGVNMSLKCYYENGKLVKIDKISISVGNGEKKEKEYYYQGINLIFANYFGFYKNKKYEGFRYYFNNDKLINEVSDKIITLNTGSYYQKEDDEIKNSLKSIINIIKDYENKKNKK